MFGDFLQDELEVERRGADRAQDVADSRLAIERVFRLVEQAHVLDRDRRLIGKRFKQVDLFRRERLRLVSPEDEHADDVLAAGQRDADEGSDVEETNARVVLGIGLGVDDRGRSPVHKDAAGEASPVGLDRLVAPVALHALLVDISGVRDDAPAVASEACDRSVIRGAQADRVHGHALEDGGELSRTSPHDAEDRGERRFARP